jgi:hypothetical protein
MKKMRNMMLAAVAVVGLVGISAPAAAQCVCCCLTPTVHDPLNWAKLGTILETAKTVSSIYSTGNSLAGKLQSAIGTKGSVPTTAYQTLAAAPPDFSAVLAISGAGLSSSAPNLSSSDQVQGWIVQALYTTSPAAATSGAAAQRRNAAMVQAARYALAVALASQADAAASQKRAAQLLQQGNSAQNVRAQIAAIQQTIEAVRAEIVANQRIEEAALELQATQAMAGQLLETGI